MLLVLFLHLIHSTFINEMNLVHAYFRPSFVPYCSSKETCEIDCTCYNSANCSVLQMDDGVRNHIVYFMNELRDIESKGKPTPSGIPILQYDQQLEEISMCWASQCIYNHSDCFVTPAFNETSQSVGMMPLVKGETPIVLWNNMLGKWLGGVDVLNVEIMTSLPEGEKGEEMYNYAQLLSDRIQYIGCAWAMFNNSILYICTFAPRGPSQGDFICKTGVSCSKCPAGYECNFMKPFTNLCKPVNIQRGRKPVVRNNEPGNTDKDDAKPTKEEKGDKKFLKAITMAITIILIAVIIIMVGGFIFYYICVV